MSETGLIMPLCGIERQVRTRLTPPPLATPPTQAWEQPAFASLCVLCMGRGWFFAIPTAVLTAPAVPRNHYASQLPQRFLYLSFPDYHAPLPNPQFFLL